MSDLTDHRVNSNSTRIVDMHGRRITNGAVAIKDSDLITFGQVKELVVKLIELQLAVLKAQQTPSVPNPRVAVYDIKDINRPFADRVGTIRIRRLSDLTKELYLGFDDAIGAAGGGYLQAYKVGTGVLPLALQPTAGGNVLVGKTTDDTTHDLQVKDGVYIEGEAKFQGSILGSGLTASRPTHTNANKELISAKIDLADTTNHVTGVLPRGNGGTGIVTTTIADLLSNLGVYDKSEVDALLATRDAAIALKATAGVQTGSTGAHTHTQV